MRVLAALLLSVFTVLSAHADDLSDFERARTLYERRNYTAAASAFKSMVGTDPPRVTERLLILESRKYLAASLLFLGQREEAKNQFRLLVRQEPGYSLDPLAFPTEVVSLFDQQAAHQAELAQADAEARRQREEQQRQAEEKARLERANLDQLLKLARESQREQANSRWIATIPFGVGQFQNGHRSFGLALAVVQGIAAAASIGTYIGHQRIANDHPAPEDVRNANSIETTLRSANIVSFSIFAAFALAGVIDAHVRFVPGRVTSRPRQLPPDLERWAQERKLSLSGFQLRF